MINDNLKKQDVVPPRMNYYSWDRCNMDMAICCAQRSKDPGTQVGAVIVNVDNRVKATGYNGLPIGIEDVDMSWNRDGKLGESKYAYVIHAEVNAILSAKADLRDCILYVTLFPCHECAKIIIQSGIREIVYLEDKYKGTDSNFIAKKLFAWTGVSCRPYKDIE